MKELLILTPPVELLSTPRKTERHDQSKLKILYIQYSGKTGEKIEVDFCFNEVKNCANKYHPPKASSCE